MDFKNCTDCKGINGGEFFLNYAMHRLKQTFRLSSKRLGHENGCLWIGSALDYLDRAIFAEIDGEHKVVSQAIWIHVVEQRHWRFYVEFMQSTRCIPARNKIISMVS